LNVTANNGDATYTQVGEMLLYDVAMAATYARHKLILN
jgi:hypothetical protein